MKALLGLILILIGLGSILLGVYVGVWQCVIISVCDLINECKADRAVDTVTVAWSLVKIILFELPLTIGFYCGIFLSAFGFTLATD